MSRLPAGEVRDGQRRMANAVAEALEEGRHLAVTAGTGTGKSFAYLVPAVLSGKRVVVATATKALQEQLDSKDLPIVLDGLRLPKGAAGRREWRWAVLKGRANYLCRQRLVEMEQAGQQASFEDLGSRRSPPTTATTTETAATTATTATTAAGAGPDRRQREPAARRPGPAGAAALGR